MRNTALLPMPKVPPLHTPVPLLFSVRMSSDFCAGPLSVSEPITLVTASPLCEPPLQLNAPEIFTVSEPVKVPPDCVSEGIVVSAPVVITIVPPLRLTAAVTEDPPLKLIEPFVISSVPAPLTLPGDEMKELPEA